MRTEFDTFHVCSDKRQLNDVFNSLLDQFNNREEWKELGLDFRPKARGFTRKSKATIEVWAYHEFECRQRTGAAPQFYVRLFVDKQLPRGVLRRMMMLWDEMPDYEVRDGALVRV